MHNPYQTQPARITFISQQTANIKLFRFELTQKVFGWKFSFIPGQFIELSLPGFGEAPFAPCQNPRSPEIELCIRSTGRLTARLHQLKVGDRVGIRGPYGQGAWPLKRYDFKKQKNLFIAVGGLGLVPLRSLLLGKSRFLGENTKVQVFYGARQPDQMLFRHEYSRWRNELNIDLCLTIDKAFPGWSGDVGLVTDLFDKRAVVQNAVAFLCGPPIMYRPLLDKLKKQGFADEDIYLSLERRMHCGIGVCQHCAVGSYYTCKDGPVFSWAQLKNIPDAI